ncbi:hypothetical protein FQN49_001092 [Arthroderma sp. PD_2]|nr:hypothetical protein FQN49_001092 [Arthroderma sp. PD_2]
MSSIPGYYFDPEKKKYYKIQPGHVAQSGSKYSKDEVKKREKNSSKKKQTISRNERTRLERVMRARILERPIIGHLGIEQETGRCRVPDRDAIAQRTIACTRLMESRRLVDLGRRGEQYCHQFVRDPRTGIILTALKPTSTANFRPISPDRPWKYDEHVDKGIIELDHREWITSLSINSMGNVLMASQDLLSGEGIRLAVGRTIEPSEAYGKSSRSVFENLLIAFKRRDEWVSSAVACPSTSKPLFAVGCSEELVTVECEASQATLARVETFPAKISDVDWLDENVAIAGLQNSIIALHDMRCKASVSRFMHSHGVQKLKRVDDSRIIVAGIDHTLDMYDLRSTRTTIKSRPNPNKQSHEPTIPYLKFSELNYTSLADMDVSSQLGLLACATDLPKVQLFSLHTGKLLEAPPIPWRKGRQRPPKTGQRNVLYRDYQSPVDCVRFETVTEPDEYSKLAVEDCGRNTNSHVSLLVGSGKIIEEWAM